MGFSELNGLDDVADALLSFGFEDFEEERTFVYCLDFEAKEA